MSAITPIVMPKWGLSMSEGRVMAWLVEDGADIEVGLPILDVETDKIANAVEAPDPGLLRRRLAVEGEVYPVKALLGVMADASVSEAEIDEYIASYVLPAAEDEGADAGPQYLWAEVQGFKLRYARRGAETGTPVLFLHGFGGDLDNWLFNLDALGEAHPVLALDLPGHGQSSPRLPGTDLAALAGVVAAFLAQLDLGPVHVVGHSMGGAIAAQLALDHPAAVRSLSLMAPAGFGPEINVGYTGGFARASSKRELKPLLEQLFQDPGLVSRQMIDDVLKYKRLDGIEDLLVALNEGLFPGGTQAALPGRALAGKPLLVVWGADDRIVPAAHAAHVPAGATVEIFPATGHMVMMEKANEVNRLIRQHVGG